MLPAGTPFFVEGDMRPAEPMCSYFFEHDKHVQAESLRDHAYDLIGLADFPARVLDPPPGLRSAIQEDLVAFGRWRTQLAPIPVGPATWRRNCVAINGFYDWSLGAGLLERRPSGRRRSGRGALFWGRPPTWTCDICRVRNG